MRLRLHRLAARDEHHGPLPAVMVLLTVVTGLVDAVSYLALDHVFVANMTGNVVFLGFALVDPRDFSVPASLLAILAFLAGALLGGRLGSHLGAHRARFLAATVLIEALLLGAALCLAVALSSSEPVRPYLLIATLAFAMGMQNAAARRLGVPDLTTTVLTLTLTAFAAESTLARGTSPRRPRRLIAVAAMLAGAALGALLLRQAGIAAVLALTLALLLVALAGALPFWRAEQAWTKGS